MTEKVKGVCLHKNRNKWQSQITLNKETKYLGFFETYEEAVKARKDAEVEYGFVHATPAPKLKHKNDLTQEMLKERFYYNPETGDFTRLVRTSNSVKIGDVAGTSDKDGYLLIGIENKLYKAHRLAFLYMDGKFPEDNLQVDHINHVKDDNRWVNLRIVTTQENGKNQTLHKTNTSGQAGVCWNKKDKKWRSGIKINGENKHLGSFKNKEDAIAARKQAEIKYNFHQNHGKVA